MNCATDVHFGQKGSGFSSRLFMGLLLCACLLAPSIAHSETGVVTKTAGWATDPAIAALLQGCRGGELTKPLQPGFGGPTTAGRAQARGVASSELYRRLVQAAIAEVDNALLGDAKEALDIYDRYANLLEEAVQRRKFLGEELPPKELENFRHLDDILLAPEADEDLAVALQANGFDRINYFLGTFQSDLGKTQVFKDLLTKDSPRSNLLLDFLTSRGPEKSVDALQELFAEMKIPGTLLNPDLTNAEIREILAENPLLLGYLHELPGMIEAVIAHESGVISRREFQKQIGIILFHNGPGKGFWRFLEEVLIPSSVKVEEATAKIVRLFRGTAFEDAERAAQDSGVIALRYRDPHFFESQVTTYFDRLSQGTRGGTRKIGKEGQYDPIKDIVGLGGAFNIEGTLAQMRELTEIAKRSDHLTDGQKTLLIKMHKVGIKYLEGALERAKARLTVEGLPNQPPQKLTIRHLDEINSITVLERNPDGTFTITESSDYSQPVRSEALPMLDAHNKIFAIYDEILASDEARYGEPMRGLSYRSVRVTN